MLRHTSKIRFQDVFENWVVKSGLVVKVVGVQGGERNVDGNELRLMVGPTVSYREPVQSFERTVSQTVKQIQEAVVPGSGQQTAELRTSSEAFSSHGESKWTRSTSQFIS
jgi:hypothetical protein